MRSSLQNALKGHTISRRSAAAGCADAQATLQSSREALRRRLRVLNEIGSATERRSGARGGSSSGSSSGSSTAAAAAAEGAAAGAAGVAQQQEGSMPSAVGAEARCNLDRFYVGGLFLTQNFLRLRRAIRASGRGCSPCRPD